jgi:hypothetical protein
MSDSLTSARDRLFSGLDHELPAPKPFDADHWVVNSLLQKSIRRSEAEVAQRAALTFLRQRGSAIWRRFVIIAFEDIGAASPDVVAITVAASMDANWRKWSGGDVAIAVYLARLLAEAPKSRSAEHLITTANCHPLFDYERSQVGNCSIAENLRVVDDNTKGLVHRAVAAWRLSGLGWKHGRVSGGDLPGLLGAFLKLGVPGELIAATGIAASLVRDAITLMVPLAWLRANDHRATLIAADTPCSLVVDDIPMYALDKHTRVGREAIRNLVKGSDEIQACLRKYVAPAQLHDAAYMAAFYADAAPLARKLAWPGCDDLEVLGVEADLFKVGVHAAFISGGQAQRVAKATRNRSASGTRCTSVDDYHMSLPQVALGNINLPDDRRLKPARLP